MKPYYNDANVTVYHGDCLDVLPELPDASVDSVVTDPPYNLTAGKKGGSGAASLNINSPAGRARISTGGGFMGKAWDSTEIAFDTVVWEHCLRVLKPGGHLLAFGGTRTWHRLAVAVEDAGFEIRDSIAWLYGSGFPKSLDVSKAIDRAAGELSPENKRFTVAGVVPGSDMLSTAPSAGYIPPQPATDAAKQWQGWGTALKPAFEPIVVARKPIHGTVATNVQVFGTGALNIDGCRVGTGGQLKWSTPRDMGYHGGSDSTGEATSNNLGRWPANLVLDGGQADELDRQSGALHKRGNVQASATAESSWFSGSGTSDVVNYDDLGGASRFFPVFRYEAKAPTTERPTANGTAHPTVKPLDLMRWLVRLVTPPHGVVLDPFAGSGTTAEACIHEHMRCITIEREADYLPLIVARLTKPLAVGFDFDFTEEQQQEVDSE